MELHLYNQAEQVVDTYRGYTLTRLGDYAYAYNPHGHLAELAVWRDGLDDPLVDIKRRVDIDLHHNRFDRSEEQRRREQLRGQFLVELERRQQVDWITLTN